MSDESRRAIYKVLSRHYTRVGITLVNNLADLEALGALQPDLVFLGMKYIPLNPDDIRGSERIWLSDYLEKHDILHTGSNQKAHQLELNKSLAKQRVLDSGLMTSPFYVIEKNHGDAEHVAIEFPLFVKPTDRGGGMGIDSYSVVHDAAGLQVKVESIAKQLQADSLVEQYLPGREFSVAILKDEITAEYSVMPIELVATTDAGGVRMLSSKVKAQNMEVVSKVTDEAIRESVCRLALAVFHALEARDYGRIDIRLNGSGVPYFLEANLLPSLIGGYGSFPKACVLNLQLEYEPMILTLVRLALSRERNIIEEEPVHETPFIIPPSLAEPVF